ncbi:aminotransferase class V-fold PLP-dependent enzyme [Halobacteriovorax sp. GB3]|uniref:cysteine desulfurase family protein n=1 Tax=Halobacteriovorax sp. GB3 TaxID=2719615 RepID=UPI00235F4DFA|nr:aminotransferase class V-fold PLP-dependent enzyme [Halobacteriovorax sp. GB3]MDD0851945.1 aminotransferase class V-fold PLP-dependent enzyme [Halobacteriovorax sp. GB3]
MLYFDYAASTPLSENALRSLKNSFESDFANPHSAHKLSKNIAKKVEGIRCSFLDFLKAKDQYELYFLSSATEANNTVIKGLGLNSESKVIFSNSDHPSTVNPLGFIEKMTGAKLFEMPLCHDATIDFESLEKLVDEATKLVVITHVNNLSGSLQNILEIAALIKKKSPKCHVHVDGVQAFSKVEFSLKDSQIDSYSISAHKICGPKGIAALYLKKGVTLEPLLHGGNQEHGMRSSTLAYPLVEAFFSAAKDQFEKLNDAYIKAKELNLFLREELSKLHQNISYPFSLESTSPYILMIQFKGISSDILLRHLEMKDVYISSSSACSSKVKGLNPSYLALGIDSKFHKNILRLSFGMDTTKDEVESLINEFRSVINEIGMLIK